MVKTVTVCDIFSNPPMFVFKFEAGAASRYGSFSTKKMRLLAARATAPQHWESSKISNLYSRCARMLQVLKRMHQSISAQAHVWQRKAKQILYQITLGAGKLTSRRSRNIYFVDCRKKMARALKSKRYIPDKQCKG
jgi:hypothetical protein